MVGTALAALTAGLVLTGCGSDSTGHDMGGTATGTAAAPSGEHNDTDIAFAPGVIPHQQGAIDMSDT